MTVEFRVLGDIEVRIDGQLIDIGHARQRQVLIALLVEVNRIVSVDQLVDRVWSDRAPYSARGTLSSYLTRLRQALAPADDASIIRRSGGYVLTVASEAVDLHHFRQLINQAHDTDDDRAMALFNQALRLWRGKAFAHLDSPWLTDIRETLNRERFAAELDLNDLRLRRGGHSRLLPALSALAGEHPLDERLAGQLMLALYRTGRQAEALRAYHDTKRRLSEELGIDPGPELRQLFQHILTENPALAAPTAVAARPPSVAPRQLPPPPRWFTGRADEMAALTRVLDSHAQAGATVVISAVAGAGGIGKTWLAVHWAHQNVDRFPDGQLFVNLRGFDPSSNPMPTAVAVRGFLDALGVAAAAMPTDLDAQLGLYRSLVAGRRMLIVLDNAPDAGCVAPLLPGSPTCAVLVTSRDRLNGLVATHGAHPVPLDMLPAPDARALLTARLGAQRVEAEPEAVAELLACCAGLPLALGVVAARADMHPDFPLSVLAAELRNTATRLGALDEEDPAASVRAVLSWSYQALAPAQARVVALLGLVSGPDVSLAAVASLADLDVADAAVILRTLERVSLVQQHRAGRYRMHDLVHLYAAEQARRDLPRAEQDDAVRRLVDFYLHTAFAADRLLYPNRDPIQLPQPAAGCRPHLLDDHTAARAWSDSEHANVLAAQHLAIQRGWHTSIWQLAWVVTSFYRRRGHFHDHIAVWQAGLAATQQSGDPTAQTLAHRRLGHAFARAGLYAEAVWHGQQALTMEEQARNTLGQAQTHRTLSWVWAKQEDHHRALEHATHALRLYRDLDNPVWEAEALAAVGWYLARLGDYAQARAHCQAALARFRRHPDRAGEASTLDSLGYIAHHTGDDNQAIDWHQQALTLRRDLGNTLTEADTLDQLGQIHHTLGNHKQARTTWQQALQLYQNQHRTQEAEQVQQQLNALDLQPNNE